MGWRQRKGRNRTVAFQRSKRQCLVADRARPSSDANPHLTLTTASDTSPIAAEGPDGSSAWSSTGVDGTRRHRLHCGLNHLLAPKYQWDEAYEYPSAAGRPRV